jgi:hypothetical protein
MSAAAIETFIDEVRLAGHRRGLMTEEHIEAIRRALVNSFNAAGEYGELLDLWDEAREVITRRCSVKERLTELGRLRRCRRREGVDLERFLLRASLRGAAHRLQPPPAPA